MPGLLTTDDTYNRVKSVFKIGLNANLNDLKHVKTYPGFHTVVRRIPEKYSKVIKELKRETINHSLFRSSVYKSCKEMKRGQERDKALSLCFKVEGIPDMLNGNLAIWHITTELLDKIFDEPDEKLINQKVNEAWSITDAMCRIRNLAGSPADIFSKRHDKKIVDETILVYKMLLSLCEDLKSIRVDCSKYMNKVRSIFVKRKGINKDLMTLANTFEHEERVKYETGSDNKVSSEALMNSLYGEGDSLGAAVVGLDDIVDLKESVRSADQKMQKILTAWLKNIEEPEIINKKWGISVIQFYSFFVVNIGGRNHIISVDHMDKMIEFIQSISNVLIGLINTSIMRSPVNTFVRFFDYMKDMAEDDPESVGEWIKAGRNLLVAQFDNGAFIDNEKALLNHMENSKRKHAIKITSIIKSLFVDQEDQLNFSLIYKIVPHPDVDMYEAFDKIRDITMPNPVSPDYMARFIGTLRKNMYISLKLAGHDIRPTDASHLSPVYSMLTRTTINMSDVRKSQPSLWSTIRFTKVSGIKTMSEIDVPISDKSSAPSYQLSEEEEFSLSDFHFKGNLSQPEYKQGYEVNCNFKPVNDVISELKKTNQLEYKGALKRFLEVKNLHEKFEAKYPGTLPEDIPSEHLSSFLEDNPKAAYNTLTEPKLKEKHKKHTRMFYMGEQKVKALTQRVERIAKQVSRRQMGVSIVKSFSSRRRDIERFARKMSQSDETENKVFISFDMSSFSKKFNMSLVREYGKLLGEITGDTFLERIDLFFRASKVFHNTRGFFGKQSGVKGGFEGFLNFIWSSIHAVVMDIALQPVGIHQGIKGDLLAYSDDGLLAIDLESGDRRRTINSILSQIRSIYSHYGLEFHWGKTLVSAVIWEFLGEVCFQAKILAMWQKELISYATVENETGFNPMYGNIQKFSSQGGALIASGFQVTLAHVMITLTSAIYIQARIPEIKKYTILCLLIAPPSIGGLRIPSPLQLQTKGSIEPESEFFADLHGLDVSFPHCAHAFIAVLKEHKLAGHHAIDCIVTGSYIKSSMPDTSGIGEENYLIQCIIQNSSVNCILTGNPYTDSVKRALLPVIESLQNVSIPIIAEVLRSTPQYIMYQESVKLVSTASGKLLAGKDNIRIAQYRNSQKTISSALIWQDKLLERKESGKAYTVFRSYIFNELFRSLSVMEPRISPRLFMTIEPEQAEITVTLNMYDNRASILANATAIETADRSINQRSTLEWEGEARGSKSDKAIAKCIKLSASIIASNPEIAPHVRSLMGTLGISIPPLSEAGRVSAMRLQAFGGSMYDFRIFGPKTLKMRSEIQLHGRLLDQLQTTERADRSTYIQSARAFALLHLESMGVLKYTIPSDNIRVFIGIKLYNIYVTPIMLPKPSNPPPRPPSTLTYTEAMRRNFEESLKDQVETLIASDIVSKVNYFRNTSRESFDMDADMIIAEGLLSFLERLTSPMRSESFTENITISALVSAHPNAAYMATQRLFDIRLRQSNSREYNIMVNSRDVSNTWAMGLIPKIASNLQEKLSHLPVEIYDTAIIDRVASRPAILIDFIRVRASSLDLMSSIRGRQKVVCLYSGIHPAAEATNEKISLFRRFLSSTISNTIAEIGDETKGYEEYKYIGRENLQIDVFLDCLFCIRSCLRASRHRPTVVNMKFANIEYFKFCLACDRAAFLVNSGEVKRDETVDFVRRYVMPQNVIEGYLAQFGGRHDMEAALRGPVRDDLVLRTKYRLKLIQKSIVSHLLTWEALREVCAEQLRAVLSGLSASFESSVVYIPTNGVMNSSLSDGTPIISLTPDYFNRVHRGDDYMSFIGDKINKVRAASQADAMALEELKYAHTLDLMQRLGVSKIRPEGMSSLFVELCSINRIMDLLSGTKASPDTSKGITVLHTRHNDISSAYMSYHVLHTYSGSRLSASIVMNASGSFSIIGAAALYNALDDTKETHAKEEGKSLSLLSIPEQKMWQTIPDLQADRIITTSLLTRARSIMLLYGHRASALNVVQSRITKFTASEHVDYNIATGVRSSNLHRPDISVEALASYFKAINANRNSTIVAEMGNFLGYCLDSPGDSKIFYQWATSYDSKTGYNKYEAEHKSSELRSMFTWLNTHSLICHPKDDEALVANLQAFVYQEKKRRDNPHEPPDIRIAGNIRHALFPGTPRSVSDVFLILSKHLGSMQDFLNTERPLSSLFFNYVNIQQARIDHDGDVMSTVNQLMITRESQGHQSRSRSSSLDSHDNERFEDDIL